MSVTIIIFKLFKIVQTKQRSLEQMLGESQQQGQVFCTVPKVRSAMLTKVHIKSSLCCKKTVPKIIWISLHENRACGLAEKDAKVKVNVWLLFTCVQNLALQHICTVQYSTVLVQHICTVHCTVLVHAVASAPIMTGSVFVRRFRFIWIPVHK